MRSVSWARTLGHCINNMRWQSVYLCNLLDISDNTCPVTSNVQALLAQIVNVFFVTSNMLLECVLLHCEVREFFGSLSIGKYALSVRLNLERVLGLRYFFSFKLHKTATKADNR